MKRWCEVARRKGGVAEGYAAKLISWLREREISMKLARLVRDGTVPAPSQPANSRPSEWLLGATGLDVLTWDCTLPLLAGPRSQP